MPLKPCNGCGKEVDETARSCPNCGRPNPAKAAKGRSGAVATALIVVLAIGGLQALRSSWKHGSHATKEATTAAPSTRAATDDRSIQITAARAKFNGDQLDECVDLNARITAIGTSVAADWRQKAEKGFATVMASMFKPKPGDKKTIELEKSCADQFRDRKPFATCTAAADRRSDAIHSVEVQIQSNRYMFETVFLSDGAMKECLSEGSKWEAVSRDSDEFRMAQLQDSTAKARKLLGKAMRDDESQ
jgi:hypothetical protein